MKKKFFLSKDDVKEVKKSLSNIENTALRTNAVTVSEMDEVGSAGDRLWIRFWVRIIFRTEIDVVTSKN